MTGVLIIDFWSPGQKRVSLTTTAVYNTKVVHYFI